MSLFGTSGIRRIADTDLLVLALKTGLAVGQVYLGIVIGGDTRTSSDAIKKAFIAGALMAGAKCSDAGTIPTPTLALAGKNFQAGAMITASHNPPEYNGIKLWNPDGSSFDIKQQKQIEDLILNNKLTSASWKELKKCEYFEGAIQNHIEHIMKYFPEAAKIKVVLDCGCAAASVISPELLERIGCEVIARNCSPSGFFPHPIEPIEGNLGSLIQATKEFGADLGIAHDGDADRMMAVDDKGRFISGDKLLVLFAQEGKSREVVTTVDASMSIDEIGLKVTRTPVGDTFVSDELKRGGDFGGEPSGAWVFPESSLCPDGIYAAAKLVDIARRHKISGLLDEIPEYPIIRGSVPSLGITMPDLKKRLSEMNALSVIDIDGIKLNFKDGWILVRPSGTEPKIRVTAEGKNENIAHQLYENVIKVIKDCTKTN